MMKMNGIDDEIKQQQRYDELANETSESLAYFYCCVAFDVPFELAAVPDSEVKDKWIEYLDNLHSLDLAEDECGNEKGFLDGLTQIHEIFGSALKDGEFSKAVDIEKTSKKKNLPGTEKQRKTWGEGDEEHRYSASDYSELDQLYSMYSSRQEKFGNMDAQLEFTLRQCARLNLLENKCIARGTDNDIKKAKTLHDMVQQLLASENLRRKDEKPGEDLRIDAVADALEKAGLLKHGKILALPDLQKALLQRLGALGGQPSHKFPYTLDAADQMILAIANTMRTNDGLPEMTELEDNMRFDENVAPEFETRPSQDELAVYEELQLFRRR